MRWFSAIGLVGIAVLVLIPSCRGQEAYFTPQNETQKNTAAGTSDSFPAAPQSSSGKTSAQSAVQANSQAIGRLGVVSGGVGRIRAARSDSARLYYACPAGTYVAITAEAEGWYGALMADGRTGWLRKERITLLDYQVVRQPKTAPATGTTPGPGVNSDRVVQTALKYLGVRYRWGGVRPSGGIDCSGFVRMVFGNNGVYLPRTAREQAQVGANVKGPDIQPGDRLYFSCKGKMVDHCGIYIGNNYFIHSSGSRGGVAIDSVFKRNYYYSLVAIRRS